MMHRYLLSWGGMERGLDDMGMVEGGDGWRRCMHYAEAFMEFLFWGNA